MNKKILFCVTSLTYGGTERVLLNYIKLLSKSGNYDLDLCVLFKINNSRSMENEFKKYINIEYLSNLQEGEKFNRLLDVYTNSYKDKIKYAFFRKKIDYKLQQRFFKLYKNKHFAAIVQADTKMPSFVRKYKNADKKIIFIHFAVEKIFGNFLKKYRLKMWKDNLKDFTGIITTSQVMTEDLDYLNSDKRKVILIYNPHIEQEIIKKSLEPLELPFGYHENEYIVSIARLDENQKDFSTLLKAMYILKNELKYPCKLIIVGDGRDRKYLTDLSNELDMQNEIVFVGTKNNTYNYTKKSKMFVLSSKFEGLPSVLIEALILDKIIISTDCPTGPKEILNNENLLSKLEDPKDLAVKIYNILNDNTLLEEMAEHLANQKKIFSSENALNKFQTLIQ